MKQIGSQNRETLQEAAFDLVEITGQKPNRSALLKDRLDGNLELWRENDTFAGYVVEIDGTGFEFVRSES
jgi:hypothetical protein